MIDADKTQDDSAKNLLIVVAKQDRENLPAWLSSCSGDVLALENINHDFEQGTIVKRLSNMIEKQQPAGIVFYSGILNYKTIIEMIQFLNPNLQFWFSAPNTSAAIGSNDKDTTGNHITENRTI